MDDESAPTMDRLYDQLTGYVKWLANRRSSDHVMMSRDDLEGELNLELVYGFMYYQDRIDNMGELIRVVKRMLHNRIGELVHRFYGTHRKVEGTILSLDQEVRDGYDTQRYSEVPAEQPSTQDVAQFNELFRRFWDKLEPDEQDIVAVVLEPDERLRSQIRLRSWRRSYIFKTCTVSIDCALVAEALHIDIEYAKRLWRSIRHKWEESA